MRRHLPHATRDRLSASRMPPRREPARTAAVPAAITRCPYAMALPF
jgi:hypothetical protein